MEWQMITALVLGIPIVLFPVAYVWYLNIGGIIAAVREGGRVVEAGPETACQR